ncbi:MAG TPA: ABC transporter permease [Bryobacteraceae bacterium]|nr:ABC transporter permease [Bryobacteraceae bacterium]
MTGPLREWRERIRGFLRGRRDDRELEAEMAAHLEMAMEDHVRRGMSPEEARRVAAVKFGSRLSASEGAGDQRGLPWLESLFKDLGYALRGLRGNPGFTVVAVATLALGIGVNAAVFTVTKAALFAGFPLVERNDRILYLSSGRGCCLSYPDFEDWRAQARSFQGMAVVHGVSGILSDESGAESYYATEVSADTFRLVGEKPVIGRDFAPSDEVAGAAPVAILNYGFWERRYGKDPAIIGRTIRMEGALTTVVGVMPPGFSFPQKQDLWIPLMRTPDLLQKREARTLWFAFGRLAEGATFEGARAEMETIGRRLGAAYPRTNQGRNLLPQVQTFNEFFFFGNENAMYRAMWGAVGFVLLIACANLANLMLARAMGRSREISVRIALGAGRWRIIRQLLIESLLLSGAGGVLGWWIARWSVRIYEFADRGPGSTSWRILDYSMDYRVFGYLIAISIGTAIPFGLAPARKLSKLDVNAMLKDGGRGSTGGGRANRLSGLLVTGEMALAVILLAGAGVMVRSFLHLYNADLGVKTENVLTLGATLPQAGYSREEARIAFYDRVRKGLAAIPGVESVSIASALPAHGASRLAVEFAGIPVDEPRRPVLSSLVIGPEYFRTLGAAVRSGREFSDADGTSGAPVAVVNERLASTWWPRENALGKRLRLFHGNVPGAWLTVVGVAPDIVQAGSTRRALGPMVYLPYRQEPSRGMVVVARTRVPPDSLAPAFRRTVQAIDSHVPVFGPLSLDERLRSNYWSQGLYGVLFVLFAGIALLLASVGLYAVIAHSVSRRTQEIGIRMAIGATAGDILQLVFRQAMVPLGIGLALGLVASLAVNRVLESVLVQVSPSDPVALGAASLSLMLAATVGCLIPARRAMRVDPANAIRHE